MALIPLAHAAVTKLPIDPADIAAINAGGDQATYGIYQGMVVGVNEFGYVKKASSAVNSFDAFALGLAGDTLARVSSYTVYAESLIVGASSNKRFSQNRVSDFYNETLGSGLMTVYISGGHFLTDMIDDSVTYTVGDRLLPMDNQTGLISNATSGGSNYRDVGFLVSGPTTYPSGVPGNNAFGSSDYSEPLDSYTALGFIGFIMQVGYR